MPPIFLGEKNCLFSGRVDDFVVFLSAFVDSIPVELLVLTAQVTRTEPFSGHFFTLPRQTFSPRSYLSSSARPSLLFFITPVSFCYCPGAFSFILCLHQGWTRRGERGGGLGTEESRSMAPFHLSTSGFLGAMP